MITSETGSGKTHAYLLPIIHKLLSEKSLGSSRKALILTPSRELSSQVKVFLFKTYFVDKRDISHRIVVTIIQN